MFQAIFSAKLAVGPDAADEPMTTIGKTIIDQVDIFKAMDDAERQAALIKNGLKSLLKTKNPPSVQIFLTRYDPQLLLFDVTNPELYKPRTDVEPLTMSYEPDKLYANI